LPFEVVEMVEEVMEREKMSRSNAVAYLIRMGYVYRYKVLPESIGEVGKG
jgi:metal-responsive CopG/Arc/MetJ family transcriptional regulator